MTNDDEVDNPMQAPTAKQYILHAASRNVAMAHTDDLERFIAANRDNQDLQDKLIAGADVVNLAAEPICSGMDSDGDMTANG